MIENPSLPEEISNSRKLTRLRLQLDELKKNTKHERLARDEYEENSKLYKIEVIEQNINDLAY